MSNNFSFSVLAAILLYHVIQGSVIVSSEETGGSVIIKGPDDRFPLESSTIVLDCQVNETADISLVTWTKTFLKSTELICTYDGNEGNINECDYVDRNFALEIENVTLSDVGTYECKVESNGQNYSERAGVSVYGSSIVTQMPRDVWEDRTYGFSCSVEVAPFNDSSELIASVQPIITAWYRIGSMGPVYLQRDSSDFIGLDNFGEVVPVYEEEFTLPEFANYDNPHFFGCNFSTAENETLYASQWASIVVPVRDVTITPTGDRFDVGDRLFCDGFGDPSPEFQWFVLDETSDPIIDGKVLLLNDSDVGYQTWTCSGRNRIGGTFIYDFDSIAFCVGDDICNGGTRPGPGPIAVLVALSVLFLVV